MSAVIGAQIPTPPCRRIATGAGRPSQSGAVEKSDGEDRRGGRLAQAPARRV